MKKEQSNHMAQVLAAILLVSALAIPSLGYAQATSSAIDERVERMTKNLGLSGAQAAQIKSELQASQSTLEADHAVSLVPIQPARQRSGRMLTAEFPDAHRARDGRQVKGCAFPLLAREGRC